MSSLHIFHTICYGILLALAFIQSAEGRVISSRSATDDAPIQHTATAGHNIELECMARGTTPPVIYWLFNGAHVEQGPLDHFADNIIAPLNPVNTNRTRINPNIRIRHDYKTISTLIIRNADSTKEGEYTCVADLPGERKTKSYYVTVEAAPFEYDSEFLKRGEHSAEEAENTDTRIYLYTKSAFEHRGVATLLICRATQGASQPPPTITWTINGTPVTSETQGFEIQNNGDLKILNTSGSIHMARIICKATGIGGSYDTQRPFVYMFADSR